MAMLRQPQAVQRARPSRPSRSAKAHGLQELLGASFQAYRDTHLAHFNVVGPSFPQLHILFEAQYNEQWLALDAIAERIRALGEPVGDGAFAVTATALPRDAANLVAHLAAQHRRVEAACRRVETAAQAANDSATADLAVGRLQAHQKHAWMLEATTGLPTGRSNR
ncbi:MAG: DNA starvation/stationary phase protection protein [Candidatus Thermoplasmatota archaeon]